MGFRALRWHLGVLMGLERAICEVSRHGVSMRRSREVMSTTNEISNGA